MSLAKKEAKVRKAARKKKMAARKHEKAKQKSPKKDHKPKAWRREDLQMVERITIMLEDIARSS
ncbi:unnamed protein product [Prunus armeniaca]